MLEHFPKVPSYLQCACCIVATSTSRNLIFWCWAAWPKCIWPEKAVWQDHFGTGDVSTVGKGILIHIVSIFIKFWRHATHRSYSKELIHHCNGDSYPMTVNFISLSEGIVHYVSSSSNSFMLILAKRSFSAPKPHWQKRTVDGFARALPLVPVHFPFS